MLAGIEERTLQETNDTSMIITIDVTSKRKKNPPKKTTQPKNKNIRDMLKQIEEYNMMINKHNQKLIIILKNQKIYGGFLEMLIFRESEMGSGK